jgi:hypothetical protein
LKNYRTLLVIGIIEILIGGVTLLGILISLLLGINTKPLNVLLFVIVSAILSALIGVGVLKFKKIAYQLLLYFSSVVFLSKLLIFLGVIHLSGALETMIPSPAKDSFSICYHGFVIYLLQRQDIKSIFHS